MKSPLLSLIECQAAALQPLQQLKLYTALRALLEVERTGALDLNLTDTMLDAGVAAWFGVTKVEAEKNFIRSRMRAAVEAVLQSASPCGHLCRQDGRLGFIPETGCPVHDTPTAPPVAPAEPEQCFSTDGEEYRYAELHEALEAIDTDEGLTEGRVIHQGDAVRKPASYYFSVDRLIDDMGERAYDDAGEYADTFPDLTKEKAAELQAIVETWLDANVDVSFYTVRNTREITVTAEMIQEHKA